MYMSSVMPYVQMNKIRWSLLIGAPLVVGVGYYIYKKRNASRDVNDAETKPKTSDKTEKPKATNSTIKMEKKPEPENLTPLEEAIKYKNQGNICFRNSVFDEAISYYDKAIEKCPQETTTDLAIFYQNRAAAFEMLKKWSAVKADCTKSLEYNPRYAKAYFRRAKANEATNDLRECLNDITATCILEEFSNESTMLFADRVLKQIGRADADSNLVKREYILPSNSFIRTYLRSFVHDPLQTITLSESALKEPKSGFARAKLLMDKEKYEEVVPACTEEIESSESESQYKSEALLLRGTFNLLAGNFEQANQDLTSLINNTDADPVLRAHAHIKRASVFIQLEKKDEGLADFEAAEKLAPKNADIYHQRAQIYLLLGQLKEGQTEYAKVIQLAPNHAIAFVQKCFADYRVALMAEDPLLMMITMSNFTKALEQFPDCVECYSLFAQVLCDQQKFDQSDKYFELAIKMSPQNAPLYVHRGVMLLQWKGDIEKAAALMERAIDVDEKCILAYETLGTLQVQRARLDEGIKLFEKAISLSKSHAELSHLYSLRNAAIAQQVVTKKLGIDIEAFRSRTQ